MEYSVSIQWFGPGRDFAGLVGHPTRIQKAQPVLANLMIGDRKPSKGDYARAGWVATALLEGAPSSLTLDDGSRVLIDRV